MGARGLTNTGAINNWIFGYGTDDLIISAPTAINNIGGYASLYSSAKDIVVRNLTVGGVLLPTAQNPLVPLVFGGFRIYCSGTLTLNAGGAIRADGNVINGGGIGATASGGVGYNRPDWTNDFAFGTLGGSGNGGNANASTNGDPGIGKINADPTRSTFLGGAGGAGTDNNGHTGGTGGVSAFYDVGLSACAPSIWQEASVYHTMGSGTPNYRNPKYIQGGCGGGGAGGLSGNGGGGAGGGVCYIAANKIVFNGGTIDVSGQSASTGGGAGGGGVCILVCNEIVWQDLYPGYAPILSYGYGAGTTLIFSNELVAKFNTSTVTRSQYLQALQAYQNA